MWFFKQWIGLHVNCTMILTHPIGPIIQYKYYLPLRPLKEDSKLCAEDTILDPEPTSRSRIRLFHRSARNPHKTKGMRNDENSINKIPQRARHIERKDPVGIRRSDQRQRRMPIRDGLVFHRSPGIRHRRGHAHMADALRRSRERRCHVLPRDADAHTEQQDIQP